MKIKYIRIPIYIAAFVLTAVLTYVFKISEIAQRENSYSMGEARLPIVYMVSDSGIKYNHLYGYASEVDYAQVRNVITPIGTDRNMTFFIETYGCNISDVYYELRDLSGQELIEKTPVTDYTESGDKIRVNTKFKNLLDAGTEYMMKITVSSKEYGEADYYSRIVLMDNANVERKIIYVRNFSLKTQNPDTLNDVIPKLEPDSTGDNTNLGHVNIHSKLSQVGFGKLLPKLESEIYIEVNEIYGDIASLTLRYNVSNEDKNGRYSYEVKEFYRINQVDDNLTYVYSFDRFMDQYFDPEVGVSNSGYIYLGITSTDEILYTCNYSGGIVCFERNDDLWLYQSAKNRFTRIFSFKEEATDGIRENNTLHGYKVIEVDRKGNVKFLVYGYMNRGIHEGNTGLAAYSYNVENNTTEELIFIPMHESYKVTERNVEKLAYINSSNILYFYHNRSIYYMNYETKECMLVDNNVLPDKCMLSGDNILMYQTGDSEYDCQEIKVMDLKDGKVQVIESGSDERISVLGYIDNNLVYGIADESDIQAENDFFPMKDIYIVDNELDAVRNYGSEGEYVTEAEFHDDKIILYRTAKDEKGEWQKLGNDQLLSNTGEQVNKGTIKVISTEDRQKETYIDADTMGTTVTNYQEAKYSYPANSVIYLKNDSEVREELYYVYTYGELYESAMDVESMIESARDTGGVVVDSTGKVIWTRYMK